MVNVSGHVCGHVTPLSDGGVTLSHACGLASPLLSTIVIENDMWLT